MRCQNAAHTLKFGRPNITGPRTGHTPPLTARHYSLDTHHGWTCLQGLDDSSATGVRTAHHRIQNGTALTTTFSRYVPRPAES